MKCTQNTHPQRASHHVQYSLLTSTNMKCVLVARELNGSMCLSCSIFVRIKIVCHPVSCVISSCWSLPYLLSSSPQHEEPPGQHDLLQDDTVHREPLPKTTRLESNAKEPLSHVNYESGGNLRTTTPTGNEPKDLATTSRSSLVDNSIIRCTERIWRTRSTSSNY